MGILDSITNKTRIYWLGLFVLAISFTVFFAAIWYAVFPFYSYSDIGLLKNLENSIPVIVGSIIFMALGTHMALSGSKHR